MLRETLGLIGSGRAARARWLYERDDTKAQLKALATDGTAAMVPDRRMQGSRRAGLSLLNRRPSNGRRRRPVARTRAWASPTACCASFT